ncbi:MAG: H-type small acid-soluble spore protein [Clostridia bacterium]|nr:H-type small acid-soluble spore protein [Clostridia bacterium]
MDINRARDIINSEDNITVTYKGKSVWINSINPNIEKAFVKTLDGTDQHYHVSVSDLIEP